MIVTRGGLVGRPTEPFLRVSTVRVGWRVGRVPESRKFVVTPKSENQYSSVGS